MASAELGRPQGGKKRERKGYTELQKGVISSGQKERSPRSPLWEVSKEKATQLFINEQPPFVSSPPQNHEATSPRKLKDLVPKEITERETIKFAVQKRNAIPEDLVTAAQKGIKLMWDRYVGEPTQVAMLFTNEDGYESRYDPYKDTFSFSLKRFEKTKKFFPQLTMDQLVLFYAAHIGTYKIHEHIGDRPQRIKSKQNQFDNERHQKEAWEEAAHVYAYYYPNPLDSFNFSSNNQHYVTPSLSKYHHPREIRQNGESSLEIFDITTGKDTPQELIDTAIEAYTLTWQEFPELTRPSVSTMVFLEEMSCTDNKGQKISHPAMHSYDGINFFAPKQIRKNPGNGLIDIHRLVVYASHEAAHEAQKIRGDVMEDTTQLSPEEHDARPYEREAKEISYRVLQKMFPLLWIWNPTIPHPGFAPQYRTSFREVNLLEDYHK